MPFLYFMLAAACAWLMAPLVRRLALRWGAGDDPDHRRKVHRERIPRLGGLAIAGGTVAAVGAAVLFGSPGGARILEFPRPVLGLGLAALIIALVGLVDDIRTISPWEVLLGEFAAAFAAWQAGFKIEVLDLGGINLQLGWWTLPVSLLFLVGLMNALNLVDGLDGLAASQALLALGVLVFQALVDGGPVAGTIGLALGGATAGFLVHNIHPARQFMGSCGSLLLGLLLGCLAVGTLRGRAGMNPLVPLLAFGLPLLDLILAIARRLARGQSPLAADRGHIHHRLLDRGYSQSGAVGVMALIQAGFALLASGALLLPDPFGLFPLLPALALALGVSFWLGYLGPSRLEKGGAA